MGDRQQRRAPSTSAEPCENITQKKDVSKGRMSGCEPAPDFRIAIDFGTTFTAVAFNKANDTTKIYTIGQFPEDPHPGLNGTQVPTEI